MGNTGSTKVHPELIEDIKPIKKIKSRIYAYQYQDASTILSDEKINDSSILVYRSKRIFNTNERIILMKWLLHKRHHLDTIIATHNDIRDMVDRIDLIPNDQIINLAKIVENKEIGKVLLEDEPR